MVPLAAGTVYFASSLSSTYGSLSRYVNVSQACEVSSGQAADVLGMNRGHNVTRSQTNLQRSRYAHSDEGLYVVGPVRFSLLALPSISLRPLTTCSRPPGTGNRLQSTSVVRKLSRSSQYRPSSLRPPSTFRCLARTVAPSADRAFARRAAGRGRQGRPRGQPRQAMESRQASGAKRRQRCAGDQHS